MRSFVAIIFFLIVTFQSFGHSIGQDAGESEKLLLTQYPGTKKWGYVFSSSKTSRIFLPTRITATSAFDAVGLGTGLIWGKKERLEFNWAIPPQYDKAAKDFDENLACVILNGRVGFIDRMNRFVIPPVYEGDDLSSFRYGLTPVCKDGKYGYIDKSGVMRIANIFDWAGDFKENALAPVKQDGKFGAIDLAGNLVVPYKYKLEEAMTTVPISNKEYREAAKKVKADKQAGVYDTLIHSLDSISAMVDRLISDSLYLPELPENKPFLSACYGSYGLTFSEKDTAWLFKPEYADIARLDESLFLLQSTDSLCGAGDAYGRIVIPCEYENVLLDVNSDVIIVQEDSLFGLYNKRGLLLSPAGFDLIGGFQEGRATVWVDYEQGILNDKGDIEDDLVERLFAQAVDCENKSDLRNARRLYRRITVIEPTFALAYHNLGIMDLNIEEYKSGMQQLTLANKLDPDNEMIAENLKQAKKERKDRRWNRVMQGLEVAGAVVGVAATTYAAIEGTSATSFQLTGAEAMSGGAVYSGGSSAVAGNSSSGYEGNPANEAEAIRLYQRMEDNVRSAVNSYQSHQRDNSVTGQMTLKNIQNGQRNMREHRSSCRKRGIIIPKSPWEDARPGINKNLYEKKKNK